MSYKAILPAALALALGTAGGVYAQGTTSPGNTSPGTMSQGTSPGAAPGTATSPTGPASVPSAPTAMTPSPTTGAPAVSGTNSATNNAVNTQPQNNPGAPVAGANSFTRGEAQRRIRNQGYTAVSNLKLDRQGIWRGMAKKNGQSVNVSMDYQGNVVAK